MEKTGVLINTCMVFVHLTLKRIPSGAKRTIPLKECLVGSKVFAEEGSQIALPEHRQEAKGQAHLHGWSQGAQAGG